MKPVNYIIGENYLCFYSLIEIILKDIGINNISQYDLANEFGVVVPEKHNIPSVYNVRYGIDDRGFGACIDCDQINKFFDTNGVPLLVHFISANPYGEYSFYTDNCYVIFTFSYGGLYDCAEKFNVGHSALLVDFETTQNIKIYDPGPLNYGEKTVRMNKMADAMYDIKGGIYVFEICKNNGEEE